MTFSRLFNAEKAPPVIFIVVIYIIGVTTNSLSDTIKEIIGLRPGLITFIGLILLCAVMLFLDPFTRFVNYSIKRSGTLDSEMKGPPKQYKGLIVFSSHGENIPAESAIRYHYPLLQQCWIITGGKLSIDAAKKMISKLILEGFPANIFIEVPMSGDDADNPAKVYEVVEAIYKNMPDGFSESDIISDYTGGTKSMTAGMILSCALPSRNLQVLKPNQYKDDGTAIREAGSKPREVDINFNLKRV